MPELPEVETVRRTLEKKIIGKVLSSPIILYPKMIKTDLDSFRRGVAGRKIISLGRRGKFLIINLDDDMRIIFHLRMEGKLFVVNKIDHSEKHLSLFLPFADDEEGLAFYDVRRFGVAYLLRSDEEGPLSKLGPEPSEISDIAHLKKHYQQSDKPIKELLLDQTIMSGLGNIYADEVCFASSISPFRRGSSLKDEDIQNILDASKAILETAIENKGSTVRSYKAAEDVSGEFQNFLKVYSREGETCLRCHEFKIEKAKLGGRGTSYCPKCQHTGVSIGITGKIATGKSLVTSYFGELGYATFSADEEVGKLYSDKTFLKDLRSLFPEIFTPELDKGLITQKLMTDRQFRRRYQNHIFSFIRERVNDFICENDGVNKAIEVPLLFESHIDRQMTFILGTESTKQEEHLLERGERDVRKKLSFNEINSYDEHREELDFIITTDGTREELFEKVKAIAEDIDRRTGISSV